MAEHPKKCVGRNASGEPCGAWTEAGGELCFPHGHPEQWAEANRRGGQVGTRSHEPLPALRLHGPSDVVVFLAETVNLVRADKLDLRTANCLGALGSVLLRAMETAELEARLTVVETALMGRKAQNKEAEARRYGRW